MSTRPTVTVIVTFWNREQYLAEAVDSVLAQGPELELVLVDDGSTDRSAEIASRYDPPGRLLRQENRGAAAAANTGVRSASGELVAFCDSDDVWTPGKLDVQIAAFESDPTLGLVFGYAEEFLSPEFDPSAVRTRAPRGLIPAKVPSAAMVRRALFDTIGPFDETLTNGAWVHWYARARVTGVNETLLADLVLRRRVHDHNNFASQENAALGYLRALRPLVRKHRDG